MTIGTHAVVRMVMAHTPTGAYRFYRMPPDGQIIGGNAVMGGRSADWFLDLLQTPEHDREAVFEMMDAYAAKIPAGSRGVRFLPFLAGQVAPVARPGARAAFSGLRFDHGHNEMYRAVLEGASFAIRSIADQVNGWCGLPTVVRLTGSGARSPLWTNMLANVLDTSLEISDEAVEARGAVACLTVALGQHADIAHAADRLVQIQRTEVPDEETAANYREIYQHWQKINQLSRAFDAGQAI
ncbi:MAG: FGGY-family carbohydrate kinase [Proteobacteria bacterium]|nr:FGGY-family carbohydrate kinase [Pseudomonadota bacterium]